MIKRCSGDPRLVDIAARLIREQNISARDEQGLARAVLSLAHDKVKFFREYPERWAAPWRTLEWGIGDCDDKSILIASLLRSFRIPVRLKFLRLIVDGQKMSHVYPEVLLSGQWYGMETVRPMPLGFSTEDFYRQRGELVASETIGDDEHGVR